MESVSASLPPPLLLTQRKPNLTSVQKLPFSPIRDRRSHSMGLMVKASGKSSESSDLDVISSIQNVWDKSEDR